MRRPISCTATIIVAWLGGTTSLAGQPVAPAPVPAAERSADIRPVEVDSEGTGPSAQAAINQALANALAQEGGTDVAAATVTASLDVQTTARPAAAGVQAGSAGQPDFAPVALRQAPTARPINAGASGAWSAGLVAGESGGHVLRFQVLRTEPMLGGGFHAKVHAVLAIYRRNEEAGGGRKRLALGHFISDGGGGLAQALYDQLVIDLTQTRRFAVLDRADSEDYAREIAFVQSNDAAPAERARAGQSLGADFILTGRLRTVAARVTGTVAHTEQQTIELTGEIVSHTTPGTRHAIAGAANAEVELIEVATRQVLFADRCAVVGTQVDALAQRITAALLDAIYPPRLIKADDPNDLVINEGSGTVRSGQRFRIMAEGGELFDPYSHESLGKSEHLAGVLEVGDVGPRTSHGRLVSGSLPADGTGLVLRPEASQPPAQPHQVARHRAAGRTVAARAATSSDAGLRLPFDH